MGASLVLYGYFGGPAAYAPTEWLIATAGQMLLFLGIVTLVSGGMEQTTCEVARRIDVLGHHLVRIGQEGAASRPHVAAGGNEPGAGSVETRLRSEIAALPQRLEERE